MSRNKSERFPCPFVIRMPADLHEAIKAKAAAEERSMAQAIRHALRLYVREET